MKKKIVKKKKVSPRKKAGRGYAKKRPALIKQKSFLVVMGLKNEYERYEKEQKDFSKFLEGKGIKPNI